MGSLAHIGPYPIVSESNLDNFGMYILIVKNGPATNVLFIYTTFH